MNKSSYVVEKCQVCDNKELEPILFLGYLPPVNQMREIGEKPHEQPSYPAQLLYCQNCHLVQLGLIVNPKILFPPDIRSINIMGSEYYYPVKMFSAII